MSNLAVHVLVRELRLRYLSVINLRAKVVTELRDGIIRCDGNLIRFYSSHGDRGAILEVKSAVVELQSVGFR